MAVFEVLSLQLLLLVFIFYFHNAPNTTAAATTVTGDKECDIDLCYDIAIRFPFQLSEHHQSNLCSYPRFDLSCNNKSQTILNLPHAGNFSVTHLSYSTQVIWMEDPDECLPKRLLNFSHFGSPFSASKLQSYTYLNCSTNETMYGYTHFPCLGGGDKYMVYVGLSSFLRYIPPSCEYMARVMAPVVGLGLPGRQGDIRLKWDDPSCRKCERKGGTCVLKSFDSLDVGCSNLPNTNTGLPRAAKYGIIMGIGVPGTLCLIGLGCYITSKFKTPRRPNIPTPQQTLQRTIFIMGLDGPTINSYPKTIIGESMRMPRANNDDDICPICLCEYKPREVLRTIPDCSHFFHAKCIDEWLKLNATCPLCRNMPDGSSSSVARSSQSCLSVSSSSSSVVSPATIV